jgi:acyl-CoA thioester hydrolase/thioesterase-3
LIGALKFRNLQGMSPVSPPPGYARFESELQVRPDDIDMNNHVHNSRYFDYVMAARYDQMERCYHLSMDEFLKAGYGWVVDTAYLEYKRPLNLGERILVTTGIEEILKDGVKVAFEIRKKQNGKLSCNGRFGFTLVSLQTGRAEAIPEWVTANYSI